MISGSRIVYYQHSCYRQQKKLRKAYPDPLLQIHPDTASKLGIANGNWVYIETPEGRIKQKAKLTEGIDPRVVHADGYWWYPELPGEDPCLFGVWESNANVLTSSAPPYDSAFGTYQLRGLLCNIEKINEEDVILVFYGA